MPRFNRYRCAFDKRDGDPHDEAFRCHACERLVCGYCAEPDDDEWLCPECEPDRVEAARMVARMAAASAPEPFHSREGRTAVDVDASTVKGASCRERVEPQENEAS